MRNILIFLLFTGVCAISIPHQSSYAQDQDIVPKRNFDSSSEDGKPKLRPFNLRGIMRGERSTNNVSPRGLPRSRNQAQAAREGDLESTQPAFRDTADANIDRLRLQLSEPFRYPLDHEEYTEITMKLQKGERDAAVSMFQQRNEYYIKKGLSDEYTKLHLAQKTGRLSVRGGRKNAVPPLPEEVRHFLQQSALVAGAEEIPEGFSPTPAKPLSRSTARTVSQPTIRSSGAPNVVVPKKRDPSNSGPKRVFPFFYQ